MLESKVNSNQPTVCQSIFLAAGRATLSIHLLREPYILLLQDPWIFFRGFFEIKSAESVVPKFYRITKSIFIKKYLKLFDLCAMC